MFPYKNLVLSGSFLWQLFARTLRYWRFQQLSNFLGRKKRVDDITEHRVPVRVPVRVGVTKSTQLVTLSSYVFITSLFQERAKY